MNKKLTLSLCIVIVVNIHNVDSRKLAYGEPCALESSDSKCDEEKNLECSSSSSPNVCACKNSSEYQNKTEYDREMEACFHIPGVSDGFSCQTDGQCKSSSYGSISRCNKEEGRCECYYDKEETQLVDNICFLVKPISFNIRSAPMKMKVCSQDQECATSTLGEFARCNLVTHSCECFDTAKNGKRPSAPYNGKCVLAKRLEEFCDSDDECRVGSLVNAICSIHPNYLSIKEKVCVCPPDVPCEGENVAAATSTAANTLKIGFLSLSILIVGIFKFN